MTLRKLFSLISLCSLVTVLFLYIALIDVHHIQPYHLIRGSARNVSAKNTFVELNVKGGLGNQLFVYAALRQFSALKNITPIVLPDHEDIAAVFKIKPADHLAVPRTGFIKVEELRRDLEGTLRLMQDMKPANISLVGYFQSPRYFENIKDEIRNEYKFHDKLRQKAETFHKTIVPKAWRGKKYIQVAIHVRRRDHVSYKFIEKLGFNFPPEGYFRLAMKHFTSRHSRVQFVVGSDDIDWCRSFFSRFPEEIEFSLNHTEGEDLAILSSCDHMITTLGTFSWWAGWLCPGTTLYYQHYYRKPSWAAMVLNHKHYIPHDDHNHWVAIRDRDDRRVFNRPQLTESVWMERHGSLTTMDFYTPDTS